MILRGVIIIAGRKWAPGTEWTVFTNETKHHPTIDSLIPITAHMPSNRITYSSRNPTNSLHHHKITCTLTVHSQLLLRAGITGACTLYQAPVDIRHRHMFWIHTHQKVLQVCIYNNNNQIMAVSEMNILVHMLDDCNPYVLCSLTCTVLLSCSLCPAAVEFYQWSPVRSHFPHYRIEVEGLLYNFWLPVVSHINLNRFNILSNSRIGSLTSHWQSSGI